MPILPTGSIDVDKCLFGQYFYNFLTFRGQTARVCILILACSWR